MWIPPEEARAPIQAIRRRYDRNATRWMPHLTLLYPFWPRTHFAEAAPRLEAACLEASAFPLVFEETRTFRHGRSGYTMWLAPEPPGPAIALQAALQAAFPECDHVSRFPGGFTPHLSVGQARGRDELEARIRDIARRWQPLTCRAEKVALIAREGDRPFEVDRTFSLARAGPAVGRTSL